MVSALYGIPAIDKIESEESKVCEGWRNRAAAGIAKNAKDILGFNLRDTHRQEIEACEEMEHETLIHDVWPAFVIDVSEDGRSKQIVKRRDFVKLLPTGPFDVLV